jgi:prolyl oligopeptidase
VPLFITHRADLEVNGKVPTYLYGYGGFNIPLPVSFSVPNLVWMEMGGIYAQAHLRGGGEYGRAWHEGGMKANKQNVFDDFIAAAEYLISAGLHRSTPQPGDRRAQQRRAAGRRMPDPAAGPVRCVPAQCGRAGYAPLPQVHHWLGLGFGLRLAEDPDEFATLLAYSPYHNVRKGVAYPPTMVLTGDHDDRVFPGHSFKFAAALQNAQAGEAPVLIRVETRAGHGAGKPTAKLIEEFSDMWTFARMQFLDNSL